MIADLKQFIRRVSVLELFVGFLLASTTATFLTAAVDGLLLFPLQGGGSSSWSQLTIAIHGHAFTFLYPLVYAIALAVACLISVRLIRRSELGMLRRCPFCLSEIPAAASVCSYCTRDVS